MNQYILPAGSTVLAANRFARATCATDLRARKIGFTRPEFQYGGVGMMMAHETAELLLQLGRIVQAASRDGVLNSAQWMALRYFSRANLLSRTPTGFANFQATSRGTASIVIKELKASGYLAQEPSETDGRSVHLRLTAKGKKALASDPFGVLVRTIDKLETKKKATLHDALDHLLTCLAAGEGAQRFGVCRACARFHEIKPSKSSDESFTCRSRAAAIEPYETDLLCIHFQPAIPS